MKAIKYSVLVMLVLYTGFSNYASAEVYSCNSNNFKIENCNPYKLVTDGNFSDSWDDIETYWKSGKDGKFVSTIDMVGKVAIKKVAIKHKIFKKENEVGAIVISSGRTETYIKYKELIYNLGKLGYTVYIHDHRGQGFSGRLAEVSEKGHVWDFNNYVTDLKTFYENEVSPNKHKNLFLLAHSMGGGIATLYLEKFPNDFKAAALSSPMHEPEVPLGFCSAATITSRVRGMETEPRYVVGGGTFLGEGEYSPKKFIENNKNMMTHSEIRFIRIQELYEAKPQVKIGAVTTHWLATACKASDDLLENASAVKVPVLVLQAEDDVAVTATGQNTFCKNLASSGKNKCESGGPVVIRGGYHELFIESDRFRIPAITHILRFFEKQS